MAEARWGLAWSDRPVEEAALFNPAFCGELIARTVAGYQEARAAALPLALAFVVLPLTLHEPTRRILPGRSNTMLLTWAADRGPLIADLPNRVLALRQHGKRSCSSFNTPLSELVQGDWKRGIAR